MASRKRSLSNDADILALHKEWDEASCPICMDHPHNAVLLLCSSHEKGCRSYVCDTSYRHSNCLDRFKKLQEENSNSPSPPNLLRRNQQNSSNSTDRNASLRATGYFPENLGLANIDTVAPAELPGGSGESSRGHVGRHFEMQERITETGDSETLRASVDIEQASTGNLFGSKLSLSCPMCRGMVLGWKVVEEARMYLNLKPRCCSREPCSFSGNYRELRRHARRVHPTVRPAEIDPSRQRAWRHLENQREYNDIVSAIRSAMPGSIVIGDYVIEDGDRLSGEMDPGSGERNRPWFPTFFLFQMLRSMDPSSDTRASRSRVASRLRRRAGALSRRRFLWGERLLGIQDDSHDEDDEVRENNLDLNIFSDTGEDSSPNPPRRRQRLTRSRSDGNRS